MIEATEVAEFPEVIKKNNVKFPEVLNFSLEIKVW